LAWRHRGRPRPSHIVFDRNPAPPPAKKGETRQILSPCLLWPNGWTDQDATWYGGRPGTRPHYVRWALSSPQKGTAAHPIFGPCLSCQTAGWMKMKLGVELGLGPGHIVSDGYPAPLPKGAQPPIFGPCLLWPNGWMDPDATCYGSRPRPRRLCLTWGPSSPRKKGKKGTAPAQFSAHVYCGRTAGWMKTPHGTEVDLGPLC